MSGIAGIVHLDGSPIDRSLLQKLTDSLAFRGPDAQQLWTGGHVGFGHTLLRTTEEAQRESQPFSLDGETWIVADARVDARSELKAKLQAHGHSDLSQSTDVELILRAYQVWGEQCVEHLLGDFTFAIWDAPRQRLFCARDHLGVRPFYYAHMGSRVIFSNTLETVRLHPAVSNELNESAIADFLILRHNHDPATTSFADIQRIPPAHTATWSREGFCLRRYWTLPVDEPLFYKRSADYIDQFQGLLRQAVGDRLRTDRVGVFMSGGLDSSTLAATAQSVIRERYSCSELRAFTKIDRFSPQERHYAGVTATYLGIPIDYYKWDEKPVDPNWERTPFRTPEPAVNPWLISSDDAYFKNLASHSRVFFYGEGPDNALTLEWIPYLRYLARHRRYGRLFRDSVSTVFAQRRPPFWGRISRKLRSLNGPRETEDGFPQWLNPSFESRLQLRARWNDLHNVALSVHPLHPRGYASFHIPLWQILFDAFEPSWTRAPIETRHPFVDLRMLRFLLRVPVLPWCRSKCLIRRAMAGKLPESVRRRPKSSVPGVLTTDWIGASRFVPFQPVAELAHYVDATRVPEEPSHDRWAFYGHLRVRSLNHWLQHSSPKPDNVHQEISDDFVSRNAGKARSKEAISQA